jgi:predicted component of type VI protein secretion system
MAAQLVSLTDGASILLDKPIILIGRHPECDIQIDSRKVSRRHCCIALVGDHLVIRDLASTNGVRINGVKVQEGRISVSDEVTIGGHRYRLSLDLLEVEVPGSEQRALGRAEPEVCPAKPAVDDEVLEACDEPMPLPGSGLAPLALPLKPPEFTAEIDQTHRADALNSRLPSSPIPPSLIIPEELKLTPGSDLDVGRSCSSP